MKFKKILCFLLVFILLFSLFLIPSEAASVPEYNIYARELVYIGTSKFVEASLFFNPFNSTKETYTNSYTTNYSSGQNVTITNSMQLSNPNGLYFLYAGNSASVTFSDVWLGARYDIAGKQYWTGLYTFITVSIYYIDGTCDTFDRLNLTTEYQGNGLHTFSFNCVPEKNVTSIVFTSQVKFAVNSSGSFVYNVRLGEFDDPVGRFILNVEQDNVPSIPSVPSIDEVDSSESAGILSNILNYFKSLYDFIGDLPGYIFDYIVYLKDALIRSLSNLHDLVDGLPSRFVVVFKSFFGDIFNSIEFHIKNISTNFTTKLTEIKNHISLLPEKFSNSILNLPSLIVNGIKGIFIPDTATLETELKATVQNIGTQLGIHFDTYERLFDTAVAPEDVVETYYIPGLGNMQLKFLDTSYLIKGVAFFRPFIRGFLVLLLVFYNWKQALTLIDQNPAIAGSAVQGFSKGGEKGE